MVAAIKALFFNFSASAVGTSGSGNERRDSCPERTFHKTLPLSAVIRPGWQILPVLGPGSSKVGENHPAVPRG
ncbi:MAG TPA: hypothetical protein VFC11_08080, partial [Methylocella sp.]|nr:hypothetical protein [Methylocella sp.]